MHPAPRPEPPARRGVLAAAGLGALTALAACTARGPSRDDGTLPPAGPLRTVTPAADDGAVLANPDRGLTRPQESHHRTAADRAFWPLGDTDWGPARADGDTVVFRYYYAESSLDGSPLTDRWLQAVADDLRAARSAGMRVVPRFAYRPGRDPVRRGRPFGDSPAVDAVLRHLDQLVPVLADGRDALLAVEQGAYGLWGEACYTDHFATGYDERVVTAQDWADRFRVLDRYLEGTAGTDLPVLVRYSAIMRRYADAHPDSPHLARLGLHDDAFASGPDDLGTFTLNAPHGLDAARDEAARVALRTPFGGECASGRPAQADLAGLESALTARRPTFLLQTQLPAGWRPHADRLRTRLGYRLHATAVRVAERPAQGRVRVEVDVANAGCAPVVRRRPVVLELAQGSRVLSVQVPGADLRDVPPDGRATWRADVPWPAGAPTGRWQVRAWLPDPSAALRADPRFAVALANAGSFDARTGRNLLGQAAIGA